MNLLLQISEYGYSSNENNFESILTYLFILIIAFLIGALLTRLVFSIPKFLKYQKANTLLLIKIARQKGVAENELDLILEIIEPDPTKINSVVEHKSMKQIDKLHHEIK